MYRRVFSIFLVSLMSYVFCTNAHAQSSLADQQFVFAYRLLQRGETHPAWNAFADFVVRFPNDDRRGDANYFQALLARREKQNDQALGYLSPIPKTNRVPTYAAMLLRGQILVELNQFDQALADLEKIDTQTLTPTVMASILNLRGMAYRRTNNWVAAADVYAQAAALESPLRGRALLNLGRTETALKKITQAITHLDQAIQTDTDAVIPAASLLAGDLSLQQNQPDAAMIYYQRVITGFASSPEFPAAALGAMWAARSTNQPQRVVQLYEQFSNRLPTDRRMESAYLLGGAYAALEQYESALATLQPHQRTTGPLHDQLLYQLAWVQQQQQQTGLMRKTLQQLIEQYPQSPLCDDAQFLLATADESTDPMRAIAQLTELITPTPTHTISPTTPTASVRPHPYRVQMLYRRARLFVLQKQFQAAADDFAAVLDQTHDAKTSSLPVALRHDAALQLIELSLRLGDASRAVNVARALLDESNLPVLVEQESMFRLALAQIKRDQPTDAANTFDQLVKKYPAHRHGNDAAYYRALLAIRLDEPNAAGALRKSASSTDLSDAMRINALRVAAVRFYERGDDMDAASTFDELIRRAGIDLLTDDERLWLAQYKLDHDQPDAALNLAESLLEQNSPTPHVPTPHVPTPHAPRPHPPHPHIPTPPTHATHARALYIVGSSQAMIGNTDAAIDHLRHAIALDQGFATPAQQQLAHVLRDAHQDDQALSEYAALAADRRANIAAAALFDAATLHQQRAAHHLRDGDRPAIKRELNEARGLFKRLIVLYPQTPESYESALELAEIEDAGDAETVLRELAEKPLNPSLANSPHTQLSKHDDHRRDPGNRGGECVGGMEYRHYRDFAKALLALRDNKRDDAVFLLHKLRDSPDVPDALAHRVIAQIKKMDGGS